MRMLLPEDMKKIKKPLPIRKEPSYSCRWPDSNRHGFPLDFESSASANSATAAYEPLIIITQIISSCKNFLQEIVW